MASFIKICPKCGHANPEYENACTVCTYFIGMETPVAASGAQQEVPQPSSEAAASGTPEAGPDRARDQQAQASSVGATASAGEHVAPARAFAARPSLYLQVFGSEQVFEVRDGWTVGQAHASSTAQLQLRDLPSIHYVHRQHARFDSRDGTWQVTAIDQREHGRDFTNPTLINQTKLAPGETQALKNGDQLSLAGVKLVVRLI